MNFFARWIVCAIAVGAAVWIVPGITTVGGDSSLVNVAVLALVLALIDMSIKPVLKFLSMPITFLTLGVFNLVVNALMLELAAWAAGGLFGAGIAIDGFGSAFFGSIIISIVSALVNSILAKDDAR